MKDIHWKRLDRKRMFTNPRLEVAMDTVELPDGTVIDDYIVVTKLDVVQAVATDTNGNLIAVNEYKYPLDATILSLPAGTVPLHTSPDPVQEALRELKEETGYTATKATLVATLNEYCTKDTHKLFVVRVEHAVKTDDVEHEVTEFMDTQLIPLADVRQSVLDGKWTSGGTIAALARCGLI